MFFTFFITSTIPVPGKIGKNKSQEGQNRNESANRVLVVVL